MSTEQGCSRDKAINASANGALWLPGHCPGTPFKDGDVKHIQLIQIIKNENINIFNHLLTIPP
jgi:hypothetical protein